MNKQKANYYELTFGIEDALLRKIRKKAQSSKVEYMQMSPADGRILQFLAQASKAKKAVEIGGLFGYSTLHIARGLQDKGKIFSIDIDLERQKTARELLKNQPEFSKIRWLNGEAEKVLSLLSKKAPFDFVFIDADKAGYMDYLLWAEKHLKTGGIMAADNTFLFDTLWEKEPRLTRLKKFHKVSKKSQEVIKKFNQRIMQAPCWSGAMIPTIDGLSAACKIKESR